MQFRRCELFFSAYFLYLIAVVAFRPVAPEIRTLVITLNIAVIAWFCLFAWAHAGKGFEILDHVRDWYPIPLILLAYREMGWIALPHNSTAFEDYWIGLDRTLLDGGLRGAIESAILLLSSFAPSCRIFSSSLTCWSTPCRWLGW